MNQKQLQLSGKNLADTVDKQTRSHMMAGIRGKDTKPELIVRRYLFRKGFRYRLHDRSLPGRPDIVLRKYKTVVLVHGCFWHMHNCPKFVWPKTRREIWEKKIMGNVARDDRNEGLLMRMGWRVIVVWECNVTPLRLAQLRKQILAS